MDPAPSSEGPMARAAHPHDMTEIAEGSSPTAIGLGLLVFPLTIAMSCWVLEPREEALVLNYGQLTARTREPGCHWHNCVGREIRKISVAQLSQDLPVQKITDSTGNPIMISAVLTYRFINPTFALLNVQSPEAFVATQAQAALKQVVGRYTYDQLKSEAADVQKELVGMLQPRVVCRRSTGALTPCVWARARMWPAR
jgi:regulator of protease activity HflC (stomatin/prohibitin superfamily)